MKILDASQVSLDEILGRGEEKQDISGVVAGIIADVKENGDSAGWILIRESGTEPLLRFYIETSDMKNMELIKGFIAKNI